MLNTILRKFGRFLGFVAALLLSLLPTYVAVTAAWFTGVLVGTIAPPPVAIASALTIGIWTMSILPVAWFLKTLAFVGRLLTLRVEKLSDRLLEVGPYAWKGGQTGAITTGTVLAIVAGSGAWKGADAGPIFALIGLSIVIGVAIGIMIGGLVAKRKRNIAATIMAFDKLPAIIQLLIARRVRVIRNLNDDMLAMPREFQATVGDGAMFYGNLLPETQAKVMAIAQAVDDLPPEVREALL